MVAIASVMRAQDGGGGATQRVVTAIAVTCHKLSQLEYTNPNHFTYLHLAQPLQYTGQLSTKGQTKMDNERLRELSTIEMEIEIAKRNKATPRHEILKGLGKEVLESALNVKMYAFRTSGGNAVAWRELEEIMYAYQDACQEKRK